MANVAHRMIETNGIHMHIAEAGEGPAVLMCHGFPESWYSWRHQLHALAEAGYRAIAPDMRGYGQTDRPDQADQYSMFHLTGDMVGVLDALEIEHAAIVGHDWGAPIAWNTALFRQDRFKAVAGLSVPFNPRARMRPSLNAPATDNAIFYQTYFQMVGVAEAELEADVRRTIINTLIGLSGDALDLSAELQMMVPRDGGWLTHKRATATLPAWLHERDIDFYAGEFARSGFRGALSWYRNIDRNWEQMAPWSNAVLSTPSLFMAGDRDLVLGFKGMDQLIPNLKARLPGLRTSMILPGCGHWIQQERPDEVNAALIAFLDGTMKR